MIEVRISSQDFMATFECDCDSELESYIYYIDKFLQKMEETYGRINYSDSDTSEEYDAIELAYIADELGLEQVVMLTELAQKIYDHMEKRYYVSNLHVIRHS